MMWSFHSKWWFEVPGPLLLLVHFVYQVQSKSSHLAGEFSCFCLLKTLWTCWFPAGLDLSICAQYQTYQWLVCWPWCYWAWLIRSPQRIYGLLSRGRCDTRANNTDELKAAIKGTWISRTPRQCHRMKSTCCTDAVIHTKGAPSTKYFSECQHVWIIKPFWSSVIF